MTERYEQTVAPAIEPLTADSDEMRRHLSLLSLDAETIAYVNELIAAARNTVERDTQRQLITATWQLTRDCFPVQRLRRNDPTSRYNGVIQLQRLPVQSVEKIEYYDTDDVLQTLDSANYRSVFADPDRPGTVELVAGQAWPGTANRIDAVIVTFVAGYGDAAGDVPHLLKHAMRLLIGDWWIDRASKGSVGSAVRDAYDALTDRYDWRGYA